MHRHAAIRRLLQLFCCAVLLTLPISAAPQARTRVDLIMGGDYVVTMDPQQLVIEHGAVGLTTGRSSRSARPRRSWTPTAPIASC